MGYICDFCGAQRSMVYCRSDAACLCLSCDRIVHDANALSKRHSRTLICERCNSQPAFVRCVDEKVSLCQNCDWSGHGGSTSSSSSHKKQTINCYSGCPSSTELSTIWSFILDLPLPTENGSSCEGFGSLTIVENGVKNSLVDKDSDPDECAVVRGTDAESADKSAIWMGSPSIPELLAPQHTHRPYELGDPTSPELDAILESVQKRNAPGAKADTIYEDDPYEDLDMDEVDLNFENYEELFGVTLTNSEKLLENGGIDSLFPKQVASTPDCSQGALGAEGSSIGPTNSMQAACSNAASADSVVSIRTEPNIGFSAKQAQSGVSFSGLIGENTGGDYQDCAASSMFLHGEPPWCPPGSESSLQSASRSKAVMRYKEKKKTRQFEKKVRYAARKARADGRKRVKGRFIKAGDAYDYDPKTRSY